MKSFVQLPAIRKSKKRTLPNLIIIGAQKCATTSLHYYLNLHPQIFMSKEKELKFFTLEHNWYKGIEWYKSNFKGEAKIYGETSPQYTNYPVFDKVSKNMYSVVPNAKLIYILRNPIDRIISHYVHNCTIGKENRNISEALADLSNNNRYIRVSKYYMQLEQYLNFFPESNILIITLENLYKHRRRTLQSVFRFLNVNENFYSSKFVSIKHKSSEKRRINRVGSILRWISDTDIAKIFSTEIRMCIGRVLYFPFSSEIERPILDKNKRKDLIDYLKDDINHLRKFTDNDFEDWCV